MTIAIVATQAQLMVALEVLRVGPADPRYEWAQRFLVVSGKAALAAIRDPHERTRLATQAREAVTANHCRRARELRQRGMTATEIGKPAYLEINRSARECLMNAGIPEIAR